MAELGKLSVARHLAVGATAVGASALAYTGVIGAGNRDERFEAKQVVVSPAGEDGVRLREVVDQDFGTTDRHGYQRVIPNDFGVPTDIEASSPDAPDQVSSFDSFDETTIRIGDPDETIDGQHRYVLSYTLPDAHLDGGELALDIIGNDETLETERFEVVVTGFQLEDPTCNVGDFGAAGGCDLVADGDVYRAVIDTLEPGQGITIGGTITGRTEPAEVPEPPLPERRDDNHAPLALAMLPIGLVTGVAGYAAARRRGRNEVYAGGAADAAYGTGPVLRPIPGAALPPPDSIPTTQIAPTTTSVRLVPDQQMDEMATIEFVPPTGVEPWLGAVVLREKVDNVSVGAWFSGLAARDVITLERAGGDEGKVTIAPGPQLHRADPEDRKLVEELFSRADQITLGSYNKQFASVWQKVRARQEHYVQRAGLWKHSPPTAGGCGGASMVPFLAVAGIWLVIGAGGILTALSGVVSSPIAAVVLGVVATAIAAYASYRTLLPVRSAQGSAIALRTESFRRFLDASEGQHVEWAWQHGLLREYSAWAVALGTASTWERALEGSSVPPAEYVSGPLIVYSMGPSFSSSYTAPSSSGSGGGGGGFSGGGFSGGSVGGGGGGGSSGSW